MKIKALLLLLAAAFALSSCTKRKPEEIDYAPNSPCNPYPADSSTNIDHTTLDVTLSWRAYDRNTDDVLTYEVFFDTLNPPVTSIASGLTSPSIFVDSLSYNTTYYWKVFATDQEGATTASPVWRFTTLPHANSAPSVPSYLYPVDNAAWQYPTLNFGWNCTDPQGSSDTLRYDLYLGVTQQPPLIPFNNDFTLFRDVSGLNYTTTYYWKVIVHDNHGAYTSGPLYSLVTRDSPWFYKKEMPSPRYGFGTGVVNGKIYVIGGTDGVSYFNEVLEYDPLLDTWTRKADMPSPRSGLAVTVWNGKIYALGGINSDDILDKNEAYDPSLNVWASLAPAPEPHYEITAHAIDGKIFMLGGVFTYEGTFGGVFEYDIASDSWWDTLFIGYDTVWTDTTFTIVDSVIVDSSYTQVKTLLPNYNRHNCSALYNGLIYVMGGADMDGVLLPTTDIYHPLTNTWSSARAMIGTANYPAAVVANGFIYVLGGYDEIYSKRVRKYDPLAGTWQVRCDLMTGRSSLGAAFVNDRIYAIGGVALLPLSSVEEYRIELDP